MPLKRRHFLQTAAKTQGQFQNGFAMQSYQPGVDQYRCCPHNYGMGWPYFTEELWLGTPDGGRATAMYAASKVRATVGTKVGTKVRARGGSKADGTTVTFTEDTDYPFGDTVTLTRSTPEPVRFPLHLRIPGWRRGHGLTVNGETLSAQDGPAFVRLDRTSADGDVVRLRLPQRTNLRTWTANRDAVSVHLGPLTYSLRIGEDYVRYGGTDAFPGYAVHATGPWNYGLTTGTSPTLARDEGPLSGNPFTHATTPVHGTGGQGLDPGASLPSRAQQAQRQSPGRRGDVDGQQRPGGAVRRQRHRRPPLEVPLMEPPPSLLGV
jgi:hypothetical protein